MPESRPVLASIKRKNWGYNPHNEHYDAGCLALMNAREVARTCVEFLRGGLPMADGRDGATRRGDVMTPSGFHLTAERLHKAQADRYTTFNAGTLRYDVHNVAEVFLWQCCGSSLPRSVVTEWLLEMCKTHRFVEDPCLRCTAELGSFQGREAYIQQQQS